MKHEIVDTIQNGGTSEMETMKQVTPFLIPLTDLLVFLQHRELETATPVLMQLRYKADATSDVLTD